MGVSGHGCCGIVGRLSKVAGMLHLALSSIDRPWEGAVSQCCGKDFWGMSLIVTTPPPPPRNSHSFGAVLGAQPHAEKCKRDCGGLWWKTWHAVGS